MQKVNSRLTRFAFLCAAILAMGGCNGGGGGTGTDTAAAAPSSAAPTAVSATATWFVPDGSTLTASQMTGLFDTSQLYFNVQSAVNVNGEIRGEINPLSTSFPTDAGNPFAPNPANNPVTFAAILGGDQVKPRNVVTSAKGYGSVTLNPQTKQLSGFIVTTGISGNSAHIHDALPGNSGATAVALEGGPVVWTLPGTTFLTDAQIVRLSAGEFYFDVENDAFPEGEIRGQLDKQVRCASLQGANEVLPVSTSASAVGFLALKQSDRQFSGFVKVAGFASVIRSVVLTIGGAGTNGIGIANLENSGGGLWTLPANTVLGDAQVANFNNDELYFNVHTGSNIEGEVRGQLLKPTVRLGTAVLNGSKVFPPVSSQGIGTGTIAWNSVTEQVNGSVKTDGFVAAATQIQSGSVTTVGPSLVALTTASQVSGTPTPRISFALDIQPILDANCIASSCHATGGAAPMSLQPGHAFASLIGLVVPGNSASSYVVSRLTGAFPPRMPFNRPPLNTASMDLIRAWIDNGAPNN